jgi:putative acetyltransferase
VISIRPETAADSAGIRAVLEAAFPTPVEAQLVDRLRAAGKALVSLVAEEGGRVVGHVLFSPVTVESGAEGGVGLAPLAVLPAYQRRGIGAALVTEGLRLCRDLGHAFVVLLGSPAYYGRFGFRRAGALGLGNEYGADEEFQALELRPGGLPVGGGLVRYGPEFAEFATT